MRWWRVLPVVWLLTIGITGCRQLTGEEESVCEPGGKFLISAPGTPAFHCGDAVFLLADEEIESLLGEGWSPPRDTRIRHPGRRMVTDTVTLKLPAFDSDYRYFWIFMEPGQSVPYPQLNGVELQSFARVASYSGLIFYALPDDCLRTGNNDLSLTAYPKSTLGPLIIAAGFSRNARRPPRFTSDFLAIDRLRLIGESRNGFTRHPYGRFSWTTTVPDDNDYVLRYGIFCPHPETPVVFIIRARRAGEGFREISRLYYRNTGSRRWQDEYLRVKEYEGETVTFEFETVPGETDSGNSAVGMWSGVGLTPKPRDDMPAVLLLTIDGLNRDTLGSCGDPEAKTPCLDRLGKRGVQFRDAFANHQLSGPAITSLLTSLPARSHRVYYNAVSPPEDDPGIADAFHQAGWVTGAVVSAFHLAGSLSHLDRAFDSYFDFDDPVTRSAEQSLHTARTWLQRNRAYPVFLWLHLADLHAPYQPFAPLADMYDPEEPKFIARRLNNAAPGNRFTNWFHSLAGSRATHHPEALYRRQLSLIDRDLESFLRALADIRKLDNTLIVLTGSNGQSFGGHGVYYTSWGPYEQNFAVPLLFHQPSRLSPHLVAGISQARDIYPTICSLTGITPVGNLEGLDLSRIVSREQAISPERTIVLECAGDIAMIARSRQFSFRLPLLNAPAFPADRALFDMERDPAQMRNRAVADPDGATRFRVMLWSFRRNLKRGNPAQPSWSPELTTKLLSFGPYQTFVPGEQQAE